MENRTIKFRAFDKIQKKMYEAYSVVDGEMCVDADFTNECENGSRRDLVWMQFTGLHDKNGKEIYCGDIVNNWKKPWKEEPYIYKTFTVEWKSEHSINGWNVVGGQTIEIIGNIYETPQLLNQG